MGPHDLLEYLVQVFERHQIPYLVTGSIAAMAYGEPRLTNGIDVVAEVTEGRIDVLVDSFPEEDFYLDAGMVREAIRHRSQFNIIHPASGLKIDVIIRSDSPFDHSRFQRARRTQATPACLAQFASPEDIIVKKMEYYSKGGSEKHLRDITGMLLTSGPEIDRDYIEKWALELGLLDVWQAVLKRIGI